MTGLTPVRYTLANGLAVIVQESRVAPAVTISAAVRAGGVCDPDGRAGLAHFVSRVLDRGTTTTPAEILAEELDNRGVSLQIAVNRHLTTVTATCLVEDFDRILAMVSDVLAHPAFPENEVETRRREIITAIRQDEDNPAAVAVETLLDLLYDGHPYGQRSKGSVATIEAIGRAELAAFHEERFGPRTTSLVIVGDLASEAALEAADRVFGRWDAEAREEPAVPAVPSCPDRRRVVTPMMNKAQVDLAYGFTALARRDPGYYALWIMNTMLGQYGLGGRLGERIREQLGMAYYVFSAVDAGRVEGPLVIRAGVSPDNVPRAVAAIEEEVSRMAADGLTEAELADAKRYLTGSIPRMLETNAGIAAFLQTAEYFDLGLDIDRRLPDLLDAVTLEDVHDVARRVLAPERAALAIAGPYNDPRR